MTCESEAECPVCSSTDLSFGYGFAGGGFGPYTVCLDCGQLICKTQSDPGQCMDHVLSPEEDP